MANDHEHAIEMWAVQLPTEEKNLSRALGVLSSEEHQFAERIAAPLERTRFVFVRGILRYLLAAYLGKPPAEITLTRNAHGKPRLAEATEAAMVSFSLSHSHHLALFAFAPYEIGIDLEYQVEGEGVEDIILGSFSTREEAALRRLPPHQRGKTALQTWVCKEAYVKAIGLGVLLPLQSVEFTFSPTGHPRLLAVSGDFNEARRWTFSLFEPLRGYQATLCWPAAASQHHQADAPPAHIFWLQSHPVATKKFGALWEDPPLAQTSLWESMPYDERHSQHAESAS